MALTCATPLGSLLFFHSNGTPKIRVDAGVDAQILSGRSKSEWTLKMGDALQAPSLGVVVARGQGGCEESTERFGGTINGPKRSNSRTPRSAIHVETRVKRGRKHGVFVNDGVLCVRRCSLQG